jgi:hypothetical protein
MLPVLLVRQHWKCGWFADTFKGKAVENQSLGPYTQYTYTQWQQVNIKIKLF